MRITLTQNVHSNSIIFFIIPRKLLIYRIYDINYEFVEYVYIFTRLFFRRVESNTGHDLKLSHYFLKKTAKKFDNLGTYIWEHYNKFWFTSWLTSYCASNLGLGRK